MKNARPKKTGGARVLAFDVLGVPQPEPRMRINTKSGHHHRSTKADPWKHAVRAAAKLAVLRAGVRGLIPLGVPIEVEMWFWFPRPKKHYLGNNRDRELRPGAPTHHPGSRMLMAAPFPV